MPDNLYVVKTQLDILLSRLFRERIKVARKEEPELVDLYSLLEEFCLRGGKRLRGYFVVLGYRMAGRKPDPEIYRVAAGIEIIHAALLIHDDIIDNDLMRRGKPALHVALAKKLGGNKQGIEAARSSGNILSSFALEVILSSHFSDEQKVLCAKTLGYGSVSTAVGELMDIVYSYKHVTQRLVETILQLKTARYSVSEPIILGYLLGGGKKNIPIIRKAGEAFGTAFQIRDDTLGIFGAKSYQSRGGDIRESKPFILAPKISEILTFDQKKLLRNIADKDKVSDADIRKIQELLIAKQLPPYAQTLARSYIERAKKQFSVTLKKSLQKEVFQIVDYILEREE